MSDGIVFCVETLTESFLRGPGGSVDVARVARFQLVDVSSGLAVALGENGTNGTLHKIEVEKPRATQKRSGPGDLLVNLIPNQQ